MPYRTLHQQKRSSQVDIHVAIPQFGRGVDKGAARGVGGAIDKPVDKAMTCHRLFDNRLAITVAGNITGRQTGIPRHFCQAPLLPLRPCRCRDR